MTSTSRVPRLRARRAHALATARIRRGLTLTELLVTLAVFTVVISSAFAFLLSQTRGFRSLAMRSDQVQSARFGRDVLRQELRAAGTNVTEDQPMIVYASDSVFAFNADVLTNRRDSAMFTGAIYVDPYATDAEAAAMAQSSARAIPGTTFTYPLADYTNLAGTAGDAETVIFRFARDTGTTDVSMFMLTRQVNANAAEVVATGLRRTTGKPFFRFWYDPSRYNTTLTSLDTVPRAWLPLAKTVTQRGVTPDTGTAATTRIDQLRGVEVSYDAARESSSKLETVTYMVPMPNTVMDRQSRACGRTPLVPSGTIGLTWRTDSLAVIVTWPRATDDGGGEADAVRYVLWRRLQGATAWGSPMATVSSEVGTTTYRYKDAGVDRGAGRRYQYALAVQDCTPNLSPLSVSGLITVP